MFAPIASVSATMSNAVRRFVPLNIVCSIKCESPFVFGVSLTLPVFTNTPIETL